MVVPYLFEPQYRTWTLWLEQQSRFQLTVSAQVYWLTHCLCWQHALHAHAVLARAPALDRARARLPSQTKLFGAPPHEAQTQYGVLQYRWRQRHFVAEQAVWLLNVGREGEVMDECCFDGASNAVKCSRLRHGCRGCGQTRARACSSCAHAGCSQSHKKLWHLRQNFFGKCRYFKMKLRWNLYLKMGLKYFCYFLTLGQ